MKAGDTYSGFLIKEIESIDEIHVTLILAEHKESGAKILHIKAKDKENLFGLCFKTYPSDDTGVAHILEHTALCGSLKYPIHDPFFSMLRRSCNTFMNAFTSKLWTGYVAASQIEKDFYNIFSVYLDAAFNPLLTKQSFMQEGHRLEFSDPNNIDSPLTIKGIVFNEMKGVFSNPSSVAWRHLIQYLYPENPYGYDSGGVPKNITSLTHEELVSFHKKFYDERVCDFFFYGDIALEKHLDFLNEKIFNKKFEKIKSIPPVDKIKRFKEAKNYNEVYFSTDANKDPIYYSLGFVTCGIEEQEQLMTLMLLDTILMDTDASLLKRKVLKTKKCKDIYAMYDSDAREVPYVIFCVGVDGDSLDLEKIILTALEEIKEEGISKEWIEGALHQLEFSKSEISGSYGPYGLELMSKTLIPHQQGANLSDGLKIHSLINSLRIKLEDPNYLKDFIQNMFLSNNHRVGLTLTPDISLREKELLQESDFLQKLSLSTSKEEKINLKKEIKDFEHYQLTSDNENVECLPMLEISDIPKQVPYFSISQSMEENNTIYHHEVFTNSIYYVDLIFDVPQIPEKDLQYLRLFSSIIPELGTKEFFWEENMQRIQRHFGSLTSGLALNVQRDDINTCYPTLSISSRFLNRNKEQCFTILKDTILNIDVDDKERIQDLITQIYSSLESDVNRKALGYALKQSCAHISPWTHLGNLWYGAPYYRFMKDLTNNLEIKMDEIIAKFKEFIKILFHLNNAHLVISCEKNDFEILKNHHFYDLLSLSNAASSYQPWIELPEPIKAQNIGVIISSNIAHNALAVMSVTILSELSPALKIASYLLENIYIHKMVREKGGAYGSGVKYNILTGVLQFYSSRDPHILSTIEAFHLAAKALAEKDISDRELSEAILSYIQDVDSPVSVSSRGSVTYFQEKVGLTKEVRQKFREDVLSLRKEDIKRAVKEIILPSLENQAIQVSYSDKQKLTEANSKLKEKLILELI